MLKSRQADAKRELESLDSFPAAQAKRRTDDVLRDLLASPPPHAKLKRKARKK